MGRAVTAVAALAAGTALAITVAIVSGEVFAISVLEAFSRGYGFPPFRTSFATPIIAYCEAVTKFGAGAGAGTLALAGAGTLALALAGALTLAGALAVALAVAVAGTLAGTLAVALAGTLAVAGGGAVAVALAGAEAVALAVALAAALALALLGTYLGWRALKGDPRDAWIRSIAIAFATTRGTSFYKADLTDADFTGATLKSTDLRETIITHTCWKNTIKFDQARPGTSYLQYENIRQLLITREGQDKNFDNFNLRGINLKGANLQDASFIGTKLNRANLQDANLSRAKLVQTQLDKADLTGATLTGATIEDWGITSHTQLQGVRCRYVFMRLPTNDNPNPRRKPDNWEEEFEDGDFTDFIKPIVDTLDLYHNQDVDPRAIAISFKQLAENNPDAELEIMAMEKRGKDKFLLRAATAPSADHSKLNTEYFTTYNNIKALVEAKAQVLLAEKDSRILSLETMIQTALQRPSFYAEAYNHQGDTMSQAPKKVSKFDLKNPQFGGGLVDADTVHAHNIGRDINNYPPEQKQNLAEAAAEIQQLLQQLEKNNPTATEAQQEAFVSAAIAPTKKERLINAIKEGGQGAIEEFLDNPYLNLAIRIIKGWRNP
ncbi:MAG: pentapeptide repeat-containing protein [Moorea sp. SIO2B7]|nr:pentapeptide repeat-containing protein [Moorena sp. SIO2B7]